MRKGPLSGLRVLELCHVAAGPFVGSLLADLGADVVKIERPDGGDYLREWGPAVGPDGRSFGVPFAALNRNKRSIVLDLQVDEDVSRLKKLTSAADVFVENLKPGSLARLGLDYADLRVANPKLVYCSISGFGKKGRLSGKAAFDVTVQAFSGLMSVTGVEGGPPAKCGVPVADFCAGLYAAYSIVACILRARATGVGGCIDCSMLGAMIGIAALQTSEYFGSGRPPVARGSSHPRNAPYQAFKAADRYFTIAAGTDRMWRSVCEVVGLATLPDDSRFRTQQLRATHQSELVAILQNRFVQRSAQHWLDELDRRGVACSPINNYEELVNDPQVMAMGLVVPLTLPNGVSTRTMAYPVGISDYEFAVYRSPPEVGVHSEEVWTEWMLAAADLS